MLQWQDVCIAFNTYKNSFPPPNLKLTKHYTISNVLFGSTKFEKHDQQDEYPNKKEICCLPELRLPVFEEQQ